MAAGPGQRAVTGGADAAARRGQGRRAVAGAGSSSVQQQALRDFDKAIGAFFDPQNPAGKPSYRSRRGTQGFVIRDVTARRLNRNHAEVFVPKCGYVRFRLSRDLPAGPGMARVTCDRSGRWHVAFPGPQPAIGRQPTAPSPASTAVSARRWSPPDGQHYRAPRISDRRAARYLALQRRMSRQHKGSTKREKTRRAMAAITGTVTDRRKDWAEKISTRLVRDHDLIAFEKLRTKDMVRKPKPVPDPDQPGAFLPNRARARGRAEPGHPGVLLGPARHPHEQKAAASGAAVIYVDPRHSSQQCRQCGHIASSSRESQAVFRCVACGHEDHADANAAKNVLARGLASLAVPAQAPGLRGVRPRKTPVNPGAAGTTQDAA